MSAEHLLDAIGLLDDELILDAERHTAPKKAPPWRSRLALAACLALAIALSRWLVLSNFHSSSGDFAGGGSPSAGASTGNGAQSFAGNAGGLSVEAPAAPENNPSQDAPPEELCILVEGVLYRSTGLLLPGEPDLSAIRVSEARAEDSAESEIKNSTGKFLSDATYAVTDSGLAVLVDREWVLFEPAEKER